MRCSYESFIGKDLSKLKSKNPLGRLFGSPVTAQFFDHGAMLPQQVERNVSPCLSGQLVVHIENILPRLSLHRTRFDLREVSSLAGEFFKDGD